MMEKLDTILSETYRVQWNQLLERIGVTTTKLSAIQHMYEDVLRILGDPTSGWDARSTKYALAASRAADFMSRNDGEWINTIKVRGSFRAALIEAKSFIQRTGNGMGRWTVAELYKQLVGLQGAYFALKTLADWHNNGGTYDAD